MQQCRCGPGAAPRASLDVPTEAILACRTANPCEPIASVPGQWAMIAIAAPHLRQAVQISSRSIGIWSP
jgi:hypothetical protein